MILLLVATAAALLLLAAYAVRVRLLGPYRPERVQKEPGSVFLGRFFIEFGYWCFAPLERSALALGLTPNQLTAASLAASLGGAVAFGLGRPMLGGALVIACAVLDALDGMVARARGTASDAGEVIDAAVDRYAEIATFAGLAAYYRFLPLGFWLALASLGGALLVSYARAKGEISGIDARMGAMNRGERALYLGIAALFSPLFARLLEPEAARPVYHLLLVTLTLVAVMANATALRRFAFIHEELRRREGGLPPPPIGLPGGWVGRAGVASAVATVIDYGTFALLVEVLGVYSGTSRALGALLGAIANFIVNKRWTFRTHSESVWGEVPRYAAISLTSLFLNTVGVVLLTEGLRWSPLLSAAIVGVIVSLGWNLPLHRYFVFHAHPRPSRPGLALVAAVASSLAAVAVLFVAYGVPFAEAGIQGFSTAASDSAVVTRANFLPKLLPDAFYSENYSYLFSAEDGSFARVQFLVSNAGLDGNGRAVARAIVVPPQGKAVQDGEAFDAGAWNALPEGAIEMGSHRLALASDGSQHLHFAGRKLVIDATVFPETQPLRPGGGRLVFDASGRAVVDHTIFALRSRFDGSIWSADQGNRPIRGFCFADTSYSTVPAHKTASLWFRMEAPGDEAGAAAALAVLFPPAGSRLPPQGWLYTSKGGRTEVRSTDVKLSFEKPRHEAGGRFEYDVPQRVVATARGAQGETVTLRVEARKLLYREDVLAELSPLSRVLLSAVAAPMAYTYENGYELRIERPGAAAEERKGGALSEFAYANHPGASF